MKYRSNIILQNGENNQCNFHANFDLLGDIYLFFFLDFNIYLIYLYSMRNKMKAYLLNNIPEGLFRSAKIKAAELGITFRELILRAIKNFLGSK